MTLATPLLGRAAEASALFPAPRSHIHGLRLVLDGPPVRYASSVDTSLRSPEDVFHLMQPFAEIEPVEVFWLLSLTTQHTLQTAPIVITRGILDTSLVHSREVFRAAIATNAAGIIVCHNHPSGNPEPSGADQQVTKTLVQAGQLLEIPVLDHVILGATTFFSMAEAGRME